MHAFLHLAISLTPAGDAADFYTEVARVAEKTGVWVAWERAPILCPTSPPHDLLHDLHTPDAAVADPGRQLGALEAVQRVVAATEVRDHRFEVFPLPNQGVRVAVVEVLGADCTT